MQQSLSLSKKYSTFLAAIVLAILGYLYVVSFSLGIRAILVVHGSALLFFLFALFARDLTHLLTFLMIFLIPMSIDYYVVRYPLAMYLYPPFIEGILVDIVDLFLMVLMMLWLARASLDRSRGYPIFGYPIGTLLFILIVYSLIAGKMKAVNFTYVYLECIAMAQGLVLYFYLINNTKTLKDMRVVVYALIAGGVANSIWMALQFVTKLNYTVKGKLIPMRPDDVGFRSMGFAGGDVIAEQMLAFLLPLVTAYFLRTSSVAKRLGLLMIAALAFAAIIFGQNRSAGSSAILGVLVVLIMAVFRKMAARLDLLKIVALGAILLILLTPFIYQRFQKHGGSFEEVRKPLMLTALKMWEDNWLLGVGASNYLFNIDKYVPVNLRYSWLAPVHNEYLLFLAERGIIGTILQYTIILLALMKLLRSSRSQDKTISVIAVGLFGGLVGSMAFRFFHWYHQLPSYTFYLVVLALTTILDNMQKDLDRGAGYGALEE
jgi:hypothetical protein